jgi:predicted transcriptional regulator
MAGKLVGEVIDALEAGLTLSDAEFRVLIAIAEKCHHITRQGAVRTDRLQAASDRSRRTVVRVLEQLKKRGLVRVVKRGYKAHGVLRAPIYELAPCATQMAQPKSLSLRHIRMSLRQIGV